MAIATVNDALAQYAANLSWQTSQASAQAALEAVRFLLINRPQRMDDNGSTMNFEQLEKEKAALEKFLGATAPRAFGRSRVNRATFSGTSGIE
jgi:hypothetical protein